MQVKWRFFLVPYQLLRLAAIHGESAPISHCVNEAFFIKAHLVSDVTPYGNPSSTSSVFALDLLSMMCLSILYLAWWIMCPRDECFHFLIIISTYFVFLSHEAPLHSLLHQSMQCEGFFYATTFQKLLLYWESPS